MTALLQVNDTPPEEGTGETEEECQAEFRPLVQLEEVEKESGEEGETALTDMCALQILRHASMEQRRPGSQKIQLSCLYLTLQSHYLNQH